MAKLQSAPTAQTIVQEREPINLDIVLTTTITVRANIRSTTDTMIWADAIRQALRAK